MSSPSTPHSSQRPGTPYATRRGLSPSDSFVLALEVEEGGAEFVWSLEDELAVNALEQAWVDAQQLREVAAALRLDAAKLRELASAALRRSSELEERVGSILARARLRANRASGALEAERRTRRREKIRTALFVDPVSPTLRTRAVSE